MPAQIRGQVVSLFLVIETGWIIVIALFYQYVDRSWKTLQFVGLAVTAFALAFAAGLAYVIQERLLRTKQLGGLFRRLPALDVLDTLGLRSVMAGFPLLTIGVVTGTMWAVRLNSGVLGLSPSQAMGLVAWGLFAAILFLRVAAGWRGRKAAIGTVLGFLCTLAVVASYVLRDVDGAG